MYSNPRPSYTLDEREVKVVLLGETGVGKSSLVIRFVTSNFKPGIVSTIGASFLSKMLVIDGVPYKFQIWDTAGQERYRSLASMYYRGAEAAIIVYDITNRQSFDNIGSYWIRELKENGPENVHLCLVGNKCDLEDERVVSAEEGRRLAEEHRALFLETSAKADTNVHALFQQIALALPSSGGPKRESLFAIDKQEKQTCCF